MKTKIHPLEALAALLMNINKTINPDYNVTSLAMLVRRGMTPGKKKSAGNTVSQLTRTSITFKVFLTGLFLYRPLSLKISVEMKLPPAEKDGKPKVVKSHVYIPCPTHDTDSK